MEDDTSNDVEAVKSIDSQDEDDPDGGERLDMEDDTSNDVEAVEYIDSQDEDNPDGGEKRPIMLLLRRLIRNKQNTVMTNAQIIDILQSEFNISINTSHNLEVDIYIKIIKKYLKDWPQWEELERISTKLSNIKDFEAVTKVLNHKYKNLKEYLGVMLEAAKPLAKEAIRNITPETSKVDEIIDSSDVVMEIQCTREQLNHLFFRRPRLDLNNTVFNMTQIEPSRISLKALTFEEILKSWWIKTTINLPHLTYLREVMYKLKHVLVNKVRNETSSQDVTLETALQMKHIKKSKSYKREEIVKQFSDIIEECVLRSYELYSVIHTIFKILMSELDESVDVFKVPGNYKRFANKYKYVRYLYTENDFSNDSRYDLQLEETVTPTYLFYIGKVGQLEKPLPPIEEWLKLECMACRIKFPANLNIMEMVQTHFNDRHLNEPNWECTHCKRPFSIDYLANNKWSHDC